MGTDVLGRGYEVKSLADYGIGPTAIISRGTADSTIEAATRFVNAVAAALGTEQGSENDF